MTLNKKDIAIVITARLHSSRLKKKPLILVNSKRLIQYVIDQCNELNGYKEIILTSESEELLKSIDCDFLKIQTKDIHHSGSERLGEVSERYDAKAYLLVPCDIWNLDQGTIDNFANNMLMLRAEFGTFVGELENPTELFDRSIVKAIIGLRNEALWFSRIPFLSDAIILPTITKNIKKQIGLYWYTKKAIEDFLALEMTACEIAESNESLRILENGHKMYCYTSDRKIESINTQNDLYKLINNWGCTVEYIK